MHRTLAATLLFTAAMLGAPGGALAGEGDGRRPAPKQPPTECVQVRAEARYSGYGYDHLVHLHNGCKKPQRCEVSTDVNPSAQVVTVPVGESTTVVTFRSSPARAFEPKVDCKPAG